ncbi:D-glycero-alpha-D-manno-heptose-1,7-bisphosphate 7-phosphatase [Azospirillum largimobile]
MVGAAAGTSGRRAVFLDRDGVVNRPVIRGGKSYPPQTLADFEILPGVADAVARLRAAGFLVIVVTNQPDIATGVQTPEVVEAMHDFLAARVPLDGIRMCPHTDAARCACRKPKPGMLMDAAAEFGIDLAASHMVGDRWRDVAAGRAAGCTTFFIDYGYAESDPSGVPHHVVADLAEAASLILASSPSDGQVSP